MTVTFSVTRKTNLFNDLDNDNFQDPGEIAFDADEIGVADAGDTLFTRVTITNTGNEDATGVSFYDNFAGSTLVNGTFNVSPIAFNDSFTASQHDASRRPGGRPPRRRRQYRHRPLPRSLGQPPHQRSRRRRRRPGHRLYRRRGQRPDHRHQQLEPEGQLHRLRRRVVQLCQRRGLHRHRHLHLHDPRRRQRPDAPAPGRSKQHGGRSRQLSGEVWYVDSHAAGGARKSAIPTTRSKRHANARTEWATHLHQELDHGSVRSRRTRS